jgi:hypothetical protein
VKEHLEELKLGGRPMTKLELANKEIERLNNIINELEIHLKILLESCYQLEDEYDLNMKIETIEEISQKLQELKGSEKSEL